jgi:hypothetical protein
MPRPKIIKLTEDEFAMYNDKEDCFGNHDPDVGYCAEVDCCQPDKCEFVELCKSICIPVFEAKANNKEPNIKVVCEGVEDDAEPEEPVDDPINEPSEKVEINRAYVLEQVVSVCDNPEVTSTNTRDKVFIGDDDVFVVTERALKINRLEDGNKLGIDEKYWKKNNRGIQIDYDSELDFKSIARKALDGLYVEKIAEEYGDKKEEPKEDLFKGFSENKTETHIDKKDEDKPSTSSQVEVEDTDEEYITEELNKGEVKKALQIIHYSNGYNEIRITSKASIEELLSKVSGLLG